MKVNIDKTIEVTDDQRKKIAQVIHGDPKRPASQWATRDEIKDYLWEHGKDWDIRLADDHADLTLADQEDVEPEDADEDLIGDASLEDLI